MAITIDAIVEMNRFICLSYSVVGEHSFNKVAFLCSLSSYLGSAEYWGVCYNMSRMHTKTTDQSVTVIRGGPKNQHRRLSLRSGANVYHALRADTDTRDVHVHREGNLTFNGQQTDIPTVLQNHGTVFNALHGKPSGMLAKLCRKFATKHTGNTHLHQAIYRRPHEQRHQFRENGVKTVPHWTFTNESGSQASNLYPAILKNLSLPAIFFPLNKTHSRPSVTAHNRGDAVGILKQALSQQNKIHAQPAHAGAVYSALALPAFRGQKPYVFPAFLRRQSRTANRPVESIEHNQWRNVPASEQTALQNFAKSAFASTDLSCLTRLDILKTEAGDLLLYHIETHPDLSRHSHLAEATDKIGARMADVFKAQVEQARSV